jgi:uncharacterized protein (TIGR02246 family)
MKNPMFTLLAVASLLGTANSAKAQSKDKASAEKTVHDYFDALNTSDAQKVVSLFTEDGVLLPSGAPTASGTEQLKGNYEYVFANFSFNLEESIAEVTVQGNVAFVRSTSKGSLVIKANGQKVEDEFRELFVMQKVKGEWKIARYMYNQSK